MFVFFYDFPYYWSNNLQLSYCNILQNSSWSKYQMAIVTSWTLRPLSTHQAFCFSLIFLYSEKYPLVKKSILSQASSLTCRKGATPWQGGMRGGHANPNHLPRGIAQPENWVWKDHSLLNPRNQSFVRYNFVFEIYIFLCYFTELKSSRCIHSYDA